MTENQTSSIAELTQKAEAGDAHAQFELAYELSKSKDIDNDINQALSWLKRAAEQQLVMAQFAFGFLQLIETKNKNISEEVSDWINDTFLLILDSLDCDINKLCSTDAYHNLQNTLASWLLSKNDSQTINLIQNLSINILKGYIIDEFKTSIIYDDNKPENAFYWLKKSEENGCIQAKYWLALCYRFGIGVEINDQLFFSLIQESAQQGIARAQYKLAEYYFMDFELEASQHLAFEWCQKAAQQGIPNAQYRLSECYFDGIGILGNNELGFIWLKNAAEQGVEEAKPRLANCYDKGIGVQRNDQQAFHWYMQAAESDHPESQYWLARYYFNGGILNQLDNTERRIVDADPRFCDIYLEKGFERAFAWAKKSAHNGYGEANLLLGFMSEYGLGIIRDRSSAFEFFKTASLDNHQGIADLFLCDYYALGIFSPKSEELKIIYGKNANPENVSAYYDIQKLLKYTSGDIHNRLLNLELDILVSCAKFDAARNLAQKNSAIVNEKYVDIAEQKEKLHLTLLEKEKELEDMMAMFAHKFRSPLDAIIYNTTHDNQPVLYTEAAQTMRGLLDVFSIISTDETVLKARLKQDNQGNSNLIAVFCTTLDMIMLHLLSVSGSEKIQQHYMAYAKAQGLCDADVTYKSWNEDFFELERKLQGEWQQAYAQLLTESANLNVRLLWLEQHFFKLELIGFDTPDIHFKEHGITASFLTILINEILMNAFKYYSSADKQPVTLQWTERDGYQVLSCRNPSVRSERAAQKGSGKGHTFLSALARKTGSQFPKPMPQDKFVLEFSIANELLISN